MLRRPLARTGTTRSGLLHYLRIEILPPGPRRRRSLTEDIEDIAEADPATVEIIVRRLADAKPDALTAQHRVRALRLLAQRYRADGGKWLARADDIDRQLAKLDLSSPSAATRLQPR